MLRYLRFNTFNSMVGLVQRRTRRRRMQLFCDLLGINRDARILDLGGRPAIWNSVPEKLNITILNLPGEAGMQVPTHHAVRFVEGDACEVTQFREGEFDVVFSNSVIEHVGPDHRQEAFASTVKRLGRRYWVQTPAKWFPIEAHTGIPFWWVYPESVRQAFLRGWRDKLPAWTDAMAGTRVLTRERLCSLFPDAELHVESLAGIPKSYSVYRRHA
jgi:hypothetical protein